MLLILLLMASCRGDIIVPDGPPVGGFNSPSHLIITTDNRQEVDSKEEYVSAGFSLTNASESVLFTDHGYIRGRGNATWQYEKKPYRIEFDNKHPIDGLAADRDWVLLADYCDKSLLRTAYILELARMTGVPYPVSYRHIEVTLNGEYLGLYILAECVERSGHRIDISNDGFILENTQYWGSEPLTFKSTHSGRFSIKYPNPKDESITRVSDSYYFISDYINAMEEALYGDSFTDPELGYRSYLEVESFARWYLVNELLGNYDPNFFYVLPQPGAKLQMAPCWDGEWSLGLAARNPNGLGWASPPTVSPVDVDIWNHEKYFSRLFEDPYFVSIVQSEWNTLKPKLPGFKATIAAVAKSIEEAQARNFERWPILDEYISVGLVALGSWEAEVAYAADFFDRRCRWFDSFIADFGKEPETGSN